MSSEHDSRHWLVAILLQLYPAVWWERYGDELDDLVADRRLSIQNAVDLLRGALDAHLNLADLLSNWSAKASRLRSTAVAAFTAWVMFCVAICGLVKCVEDPAFIKLAQDDPALGLSYAVMQAAFAFAALAVLAGGLPLAVVAVQQAWRRRDATLGRMLCIPILATAALVAYTLLAVQYAAVDGASVHSPIIVTIFCGLVALLAASAIAIIAAVRVTMYRINPTVGLLQWAGWAALSAAVAITTGVAAMAMYGYLLRGDDPALFGSANGLLATSLPANYIVMLIIGSIAAIHVDRSAIRSLKTLLTMD